MKNIFDPSTTTHLLERIAKLNPQSNPLWGKMSVAQMLAHCCVPYEGIYENKPKATGLKKILLRFFLKNQLTNEKPYAKNGRTAPEFLITDNRDFDKEKSKLTAFISKTEQLGAPHFEGLESTSIGTLSANEWSNLLYKHLDHHLTQFGV
jgi:hypothetical protein